MASEIDKRQQTEAQRRDPNFNPFLSYGEQAAQQQIVGKLLKFSKGDFLAGEDNEEIEHGTQFVVNMSTFRVGWQRWFENQPVEQVMGRLEDGYQPPKRDELGHTDQDEWETDSIGESRDPWQFSNQVVLLAHDLELDEGEDGLFTLAASGKGSINALGLFCKAYGRAMRQHPDEWPIMSIGSDSYQHKKREYGRIKFPVYRIVGWAPKSDFPDLEDNIDDSGPPAAAAQVEEKPQAKTNGNAKPKAKAAPVQEILEPEPEQPEQKAKVKPKGKARF